jgi:hypothetical protein
MVLRRLVVISFGLRLLTVVAALEAVMFWLMAKGVRFPEPPGGDHISEGPFAKAKRQRTGYYRRAAWALAVGAASLAMDLGVGFTMR